MNTNQTQAVQTIPTQVPEMTQIPLDPHNPLAWILVLTVFLGTTEKNLNAIANLLTAITLFLKSRNRAK